MKILVATTNPGKVREFREMLGTDRFEWIGLADLPPYPVVEETGHSFRANAVLKAEGYSRLSGMWTLADDSGLEVDALNQKPGIHSARWASLHGAGSGDAANNGLLLEQLRDVSEGSRSARFVCVLALAEPTGKIILTTRDTMEGRIGFSASGENGFGYDPLFLVKDLDRTSAQLLPADKHRISHRGRALQRMNRLLAGLQIRPGGVMETRTARI